MLWNFCGVCISIHIFHSVEVETVVTLIYIRTFLTGELSSHGRIFFHSSDSAEKMIYFRVASLGFDRRTFSLHVTCLIQIHHFEMARIQNWYFYKYFRIWYISEETIILSLKSMKEVTWFAFFHFFRHMIKNKPHLRFWRYIILHPRILGNMIVTGLSIV
jgi:hypothetical protein